MAAFLASVAIFVMAAMALRRKLPAQNVLFILLTLCAVEMGLGILFKRRDILQRALFWPGAIVLSRIAAKMLLTPWRRSPNYGLCLLAAAAGETALVEIFLGPWTAAAERFLLTLVCLLVLTPWFLQKRVTASEESKAAG